MRGRGWHQAKTSGSILTLKFNPRFAPRSSRLKVALRSKGHWFWESTRTEGLEDRALVGGCLMSRPLRHWYQCDVLP